MNIKTAVTLILILLLFTFPPKAYAKDHASAYLLMFDADGNNYWQEESVLINENASLNVQAYEVFQQLLKDHESNRYNFPPGTEIQGVFRIDNCLYVNVSKEILDYGGGSYYEETIKNQLIKTALNFEGIDTVTLLIDGFLDPLPEGSIIKEAPIWQEMTEEEMIN